MPGPSGLADSYPSVSPLPLAAASTTAVVATSNTMVRPADTTAYAVGDLVANSVTAGSVAPLTFTGLTSGPQYGGTVRIDRVRVRTSSISVSNALFRVHFYAATVTPSNGDNAAWLTPVANYIGAADVTVDEVFSNGAEGVGLPVVGAAILGNVPAGANLFALIEARAPYVPTSAGTFTVIVEGYRL